MLANQQLIKINKLLKALDLIFTANVFQESKMFQQTMFFNFNDTCFLQQVQKVTSVSSDWLILIHVVYFFCGNYD